MTTTWQLIDLSKNNINRIYSVTSELDKVVLVTPDKLYSVLRNGELLELQKVDFPYETSYKPAKSLTFVGSDRQLYSNKLGSYKIYEKLGSIASNRLVTDDDNILSIGDKLTLEYLEKGKTKKSFQIPGFSDWSVNFFSGAVLKGSKLYFLNMWGAKSYYTLAETASERLERSKQAKNVVLEIDLKTKEIKDITEDLGCLNMLGQPYGTVRSLTSNAAKTVLYISTEQGIYQRKIDAKGWEMIYPAWGNYSLYIQPDDSLVCVQSSENNHTFTLFKNGNWLKLSNFECSVKLNLNSVVLKGSYLYASFVETDPSANKKPHLAILEVSSFKPETYNSPKIANYLNLADPVCSKIVRHTGELAIATKDSVYSIDEKTGQAFKVISVDTKEYGEILDIEAIKNGCLIVTTTYLLMYSGLDESLTVLATGKASSNSKVIEENEIIYYLANKQITVFNQLTDQTTYQSIDADFINDIAVKDGFLYVCGFNNRKNNGTPVQVAFLLKFKYSDNTLTQVDKLYGYDSTLLGSDMADTRLYKLYIQGNSLHILGEQAGGNGIFRWNGKDLSTETFKHSDAYNYPGVGKARDSHILYYGVVNLETFLTEKGQFSIPRLPKDLVSNSNRARSIFADDENIYIGSESAYGIEGREVFKFLGKNAPTYRSDAALLKVSKDLKVRKYWFTPGSGQVLFHNSQYAVIKTDNMGDLATNQGTIDNTIASNTYLIVW